MVNLGGIIHCSNFSDNVSDTLLCLRPRVKNLLCWAQSIELGPISGDKVQSPKRRLK
jgi:hypothetical protein